MFPTKASILLVGVLLIVPGCGSLEWLSPSSDPQRDFLVARAAARSIAETEVADEHACHDGEELGAGLRDYQKQEICSMCKKGQIFVADGKGVGVETCSACGSGDLVMKLGDDARKPWCDDLPGVKQAEEKASQSGTNLGARFTELLPLELSAAETHYRCRAGDQGAGGSERQSREDEKFAEQNAALNSQAQAEWAQARAAQQQARTAQQAAAAQERAAQRKYQLQLVPSPPFVTN